MAAIFVKCEEVGPVVFNTIKFGLTYDLFEDNKMAIYGSRPKVMAALKNTRTTIYKDRDLVID